MVNGEAEMDQSNLLENMVELNNKSKPKKKKVRKIKEILLIVRVVIMKVGN